MEQRRNPWGGAANGTIAFSHGDAVSSIFTVNADSTGQTNLTPETNASANSGPAWPPDGSKIAFESSAAGPPSEIYVVNTDGSNRMQLTASADEERTPAWSPDGSKIAFVRWLPAGQGQVLPKIYVMNADGSNQVQLRTETTFSEESPDWSPDGSKIVFVDAGGGSHIYTMNADGTPNAAHGGQLIYTGVSGLVTRRIEDRVRRI